MLNLGCGQYLRNPFFPGFWGQKWGCGFCILADYTRLYTVTKFEPFSDSFSPEKFTILTTFSSCSIVRWPLNIHLLIKNQVLAS